jgi:hypothetical protein
MFHFNPKISIEVCLHHNHAVPLYGDKFIKARTAYIDLRLNVFLSNIAHAHATLCRYPPPVVDRAAKLAVAKRSNTRVDRSIPGQWVTFNRSGDNSQRLSE